MEQKEKPPAAGGGKGHGKLHNPTRASNLTAKANAGKESPYTDYLNAPATPNTEAALSFLERWKPEGPWALTAIKPDKKAIHGRLFTREQFDAMKKWIADHNGKFNVYFSVNTVMRAFEQKAGRDNIGSMDWLHVDIDAPPINPDLPDAEKADHLRLEFESIYEKLTTKLPKGVPPPSVVTYSGGGFQAFWALAEPFIINGDEAKYEEAKLYNVQLERVFDADNCHNVDRIMRLPGTVNIPDAKKLKKGRKPKRACVIKFDGDAVYELKDFTKASPDSAENTSGGTGGTDENIKAERIADVSALDKWNVSDRVKVIIVQGHHPEETKEDNSRSAWLFDAVCQLYRCNVPDEVVYGIITDRSFGISASVLDKGSNVEKYARRQMERAKEEISDEPDAVAMREINRLHAVISNYGGKTRVMTEGPPPYFQSFDDFRNRYMNRYVKIGTGDDGKPIFTPLGKWWLAQQRRRQYERVEFRPGAALPDSVFNLWSGFAVEPVDGLCDLFLALVRDVICAGSDIANEWLLNWMAHAVQRPQEPGEVAVVLRGGQGIGKSFFAERFGELFGRHFVPVTDPKHVVGNFNAILHDALFVFSDEAFAANDKRAEGVLKGLVTQAHITVEPKGVDAFKARKFFRLVMASNNSWVVPADIDDRRFLVLDVSDIHKQQTAYFAAIADEWRNGGREALMHLLLNRDIAEFDHRRRPETAALVDQQLHSLRGARRIVYEMLASGDPPVAKVEGERVFISTRDLRRDREERCSETMLGRELEKIADGRKKCRETCDENEKKVRKNGVWLPRLSEARSRWAAHVNLNVRWPVDDGEWASSTDEPSKPPF